MPEYVHMYLQIPPKHSISDVVKWLKGKTAERLSKKFPELTKRYWGRHLWARGYFVSTVGIADNIIREYIQNQRQDELSDFNDLWKKEIN
jgi:putative transposase